MVKTKTFEVALEELETIVNSMEDGDIPLDKMINSYEDGMKLVNFCNKKLQTMEKRIEVLKVTDSAPKETAKKATKKIVNNDSWDSFDSSSERDISSQQPNANNDSDDLPF